MSWLLDTNVLLRLVDAGSPQHAVAEAAIEHLLAGGETVFISAQVLVEFWAVATRPEPADGSRCFTRLPMSWIAGSIW
jgi:predicted nucleic acid-binding protein